MSTGNLIYRLRKAYTEQLTRMQVDVLRGAYPQEEYLRQCGKFSGVEWALAELNQLAGTYNESDEDNDGDELTQIHDT